MLEPEGSMASFANTTVYIECIYEQLYVVTHTKYNHNMYWAPFSELGLSNLTGGYFSDGSGLA